MVPQGFIRSLACSRALGERRSSRTRPASRSLDRRDLSRRIPPRAPRFPRGHRTLQTAHQPAPRYSEDLDFVQLTAEGIGPVINRLRELLGWLDPDPDRDRQASSTDVVFHYQSTSGTPARLKIEIYTREQFSAPNVVEQRFAVRSPFFEGDAPVATYRVNELLATKLRALYQRKKGRDLFDLWWANGHATVDLDVVMPLFEQYWGAREAARLTQPQMRRNLEDKREENVFADVEPLLAEGVTYDWAKAYDWFMGEVLPRLRP